MFARPSTPAATFPPEIWDDLVTGPIALAHWMAGPAGANEQTIRELLEGAARKFENLPLIAAICRAGERRTHPVQHLQESDIFVACAGGVGQMESKALPFEVAAYRLLLIETAEDVARRTSGKTDEIPDAHKRAINRLIDALGAQDLVQKWPLQGEGEESRPAAMNRTNRATA